MTMKHNIAKLFAAAATVAAVVAGCSALQEENGSRMREIKFAASVGTFQVKATDTAFEEGDAIGLYAEYPVNVNNVRLAWQNGGLVPEAPVYWGSDQLVDQSSLFYAYYPYSDQTGGRYIDFTVKEDQSTPGAYTASDLMTAATYATPADGTVQLNFVHRLSKLVLTIENHLDSELVKEVYLGNVLLSASLDLAFSQDYSSYGEPGVVKLCEGGIVTEDGVASQAWSAIIPAQNTNPRIKVVTQSGKEYVYESDYSVYFSPSRRYLGHLIIDQTAISTTFSSIIYDWYDGGDFWFKQDNPAKYIGDWSVIGGIQGSNWDTDFWMERTGDFTWSTTIEYHAGEWFKFRMNGDWNVNLGTPWNAVLNSWEWISLMDDGFDMQLAEDGIWSLNIDVRYKEFYAYKIADLSPGEIVLSDIQPVVDYPDDTWVDFTQVVYALSSRGFVLFDGKYSILVYTASDPGVQIGDIVHVSGNRIHYNNVPEVNQPSWEVVGHTDELMDLTYMYNDVTGYLDQDFASIAIPIAIEGVVSSDGYTIEVADQAFNGNIFYPVSELLLTGLYGHRVRVSGFYNGRRDDRLLVYIIATAVEDYGEEQSGYTAQGDGSLSNPFNATAAYQYAASLASGEVVGPVYVQGVISSVKYTYAEPYGTATFFISDDGSTGAPQFQVYSVLYFNGAAWVEGDAQIAVGDNVTVYGNITNYNGTPETQSKQAWLYSLNGWTGPEA